jgi:serpin B
MERRTFLSLLAAPAVAHLIAGCDDEDDTATTDTPTTGGSGSIPAGGDEVRSDLQRSGTTEADAAPAAAAVNAFGDDVFGALLAAQPESNWVFSPASVAVALTMTSAGAAGGTLTAMDGTLHITPQLTGPATIHHAMNALDTALASRNQSQPARTPEDAPVEVDLSIANSLWGQEGFAFEQPFLDVLAGEYGAGLQLVDYVDDPDGAREAINTWVDEATNARIPELLAEGSITPDTRLTLVNAIYLKATWASVFAKDVTRDAPFTLLDGSAVDVATMHQEASFDYASGPGWQAVELPYAFGELAMTIVVPDNPPGPRPPFAEVVAALAPARVQLALPKFDVETSTSLGELLTQLGMGVAFTPDADFTAMTTTEPVWIGEVVHQANLTVDEEGTEAAAATAVIAVGGAAPIDPPVELNVDRPFAFALRDLPTGTVIFSGRITDPSAIR